MSLEKKYNSIDQSKLKPAVRDILKKMKEKSENFTNSDINKKVEPALDKLLMRLEKELPEAIKKETKTPPKPKDKPKATPMKVGEEWIAFIEDSKGKKLEKTFKSQRAAKMWHKKNADKISEINLKYIIMSKNIADDFMNAFINGDVSRHPINDIIDDSNMDSPNHFLKQKSFNFEDVLKDMSSREKINFFPSNQEGDCHQTSMFVSFRKPILKFKMPKSNFVALDIVLKEMVKQVLGNCYGKNQKIILLTDEISNSKSEEWHANLRTMQKQCESIEVYYVFPNGKHENANRFFGLQ